MTSGNAVKVGIIVVGFAAAGFLWFGGSGAERSELVVPPDAAPLDMCCTACGHHFTLGVDAMRQQVANTPQPSPPSDEGGGKFRFSERRPDVVPCPECSKNTAVLGTKCPVHGTYYPAMDLEGRRRRCPECG